MEINLKNAFMGEYNVQRERLGATLQEILTAARLAVRDPTGGGSFDPGSGVLSLPPAGSGADVPPADPNKASVTPDSADNGLLWLGGFALLAAIVWPKARVTGTPSAKWMLPALGVVAAGVLYWKFGGKSTAEKKAALVAWITANAGQGDDISDFTGKLNLMSDQEISDVYDWVFKYTEQTRATAPDDFRVRMAAISSKYQIFT
jgi:hypothetical protein